MERAVAPLILLAILFVAGWLLTVTTDWLLKKAPRWIAWTVFAIWLYLLLYLTYPDGAQR